MLNDYATHLPVLGALAHLPIRRVLEFGCGLYSTPAFLRYEKLERLDCVEHQPDWVEWVQEVLCDDRLRLIEDEAVRLHNYDLIFIDDGLCPEERVPTIERVARGDPHGVVVIHDFQQNVYREAVQGWSMHVYRHQSGIDTGVYYDASPLRSCVAFALEALCGS